MDHDPVDDPGTSTVEARENETQAPAKHGEVMAVVAGSALNADKTESDVKFRFDHHMLTAFTSAISPDHASTHQAPPAPPARGRVFDIRTLLTLNWTSNFTLWESHIAA